MSRPSSVRLDARWMLNAAMLSTPIDLSTLVTVSRQKPDALLQDDCLDVMVSKLLNSENPRRCDSGTRLDCLNILSNVATAGPQARERVKRCLMGVSQWFDAYVSAEGARHRGPSGGCNGEALGSEGLREEPELHKAMLVLLARAWDYAIATGDLLELTSGDVFLALETVVGVLQDGETYSTDLRQRQQPGDGKLGQWEHELVSHRYEKPLVLQLCRLVRGFTHPGTYFNRVGANNNGSEDPSTFSEGSVEEFSIQIDSLLDLALRSNVIDKLASALSVCLFPGLNGCSSEGNGEEDSDGKDKLNGASLLKSGGCNRLEECDHLAVEALHSFIQNLYSYGNRNSEVYRQHLLCDTLLAPQLVAPYIDASGRRRESKDDASRSPRTTSRALLRGLAASLRTLVIASFRAPPTVFSMDLLRRFNPTASILRASALIAANGYVFALLCLLNVNMGALDGAALAQARGLKGAERRRVNNHGGSGGGSPGSDGDDENEAEEAQLLLDALSAVYHSMAPELRRSVCTRVGRSGALPIARDTPSYAAVVNFLIDGEVSGNGNNGNGNGNFNPSSYGEGDSNERSVQADRYEQHNGRSGGSTKGRKISEGEGGLHLRAEGKGCEEDDDVDWQGCRREAKSAAEERITHAVRRLRHNRNGSNGSGGRAGHRQADEEPRSERGAKQEETQEQEQQRRQRSELVLLGDLPTLGKKTSAIALEDLKRQRLRVELDLPASGFGRAFRSSEGGIEEEKDDKGPVGGLRSVTSTDLGGSRRRTSPRHKHSSADSPTGSHRRTRRREGEEWNDKRETPTKTPEEDEAALLEGGGGSPEKTAEYDIPQQFRCGINGHLMRQPLRSPYGHVFELTTIRLWLETRGQTCPLTGKPLTMDQLTPDAALRTDIVRWHIQRTARATPSLDGESLYDF